MGLVELGKHTGLSPALLSKIERNRLFPRCRRFCASRWSSASTWRSSSPAPARNLSSPSSGKHIACGLPERQGSDSAYKFESLDYPVSERKFDSYYADFLPVSRAALRLHDHPGVELIYALEGTLSVHIGGEEHTLEAGDSMYFDSSVPHGYRRSGGRTCSAIVVTG